MKSALQHALSSVILFTCLAFPICQSDAATGHRPNVVIIHCHDLGQYLHCYGVKTVQTPNFDKLAEQGVRFSRSFCAQPGCSPSRAALFTGRYPHNNGVMGLTHANFAWDLNPGEKHLARYLKEAGYSTVAIGVIHETHSGAERLGYDQHIRKNRAAEATTAGLKQLKQLADAKKPFYLYAGFTEPHRLPMPGTEEGHGFPGPHLKPDNSLGVEIPGYLRDTPGTREELAGLQGAVRHVDEQLGKWMQALHDLDLEENTLLLATTDHGVAMPRAKCSVYEPGLQVALLLRYSGRKGWHGGIVKNEMISNIDVLPTILEIAGIPIPGVVQGRSLAALLDGRDYKPNAAIFGELTYHDYYDPQRSVRTDTHKLIANFSAAPSFMDPSQQWRPKSDVLSPESPASAYHPLIELYDLSKDPWEQVNLANRPEARQIRKELTALLYEHMVNTQDPLLKGAVTSPQHENTMKLLKGEKEER